MRDRALNDELALLAPAERAWAEADLALRERAATIASDLGLDTRDVYHILRSLQRSPSERLRRGLSHGRIGRRLAE